MASCYYVQQLKMHISKTSGYAVHALISIGNAEEQTCFVRDIAKGTGLKKPYLAKIINQLVHRGFLVAKRGYHGGVALARPPEQISLLQVVQALEGEGWRHSCLFGLEACPGLRQCPAHAVWQEMQDKVEKLLRSATLAEVMKAVRPPARADQAAGKVSSASFDWPRSSPLAPSLRLLELNPPPVPVLSQAG